jgi:hypothetical protein
VSVVRDPEQGLATLVASERLISAKFARLSAIIDDLAEYDPCDVAGCPSADGLDVFAVAIPGIQANVLLTLCAPHSAVVSKHLGLQRCVLHVEEPCPS